MFTKIRLSIAIIAFTPLISLTAHSDIQNQILLQIDKLNRRDVGVPKATDPCTDCQAENSARELFNKCVDTICTSKGLRPYTSIPVENQTDLTTPVEGEKEYVELLNKIGEANKSSIPKKVQDNLLKLISSGKLEFSKEQADFAMQFIALSIFSSYSELDVAKKEYKFNEDAWNKAKLPLSAKNTAVLKIYLQNFLKRLGKIAFADRKALESSKSYLETKYPGVSKDHAIKQMVADFRADFEKFKSTGFGKLVSTMTDVDMMFPKELVSTIESGKDITEMNFKDLLAQKTQFENYQTFFDETDSKNLSAFIDLTDLKKRVLNPKVARQAALKEKAEKKENELKASDRTAQCISALRLNSRNLPTDDQLKKLSAEIEDVKKSILNQVGSRYSAHTRKLIESYLDRALFFPPLSKDEYRNGLKSRLLREIDQKQRTSNLKIKDQNATAVFLALASFQQILQTSQKKSNSSSSYCDEDKFEALSDANYTLQGRIQVSYTVTHALDMGRGVIAHELGHGIWNLFSPSYQNNLADDSSKKPSGESTLKHAQVIQCLANQHESNGLQYTGEDYADFVAGQVSKTNLSCLFPQVLYEGKAVQNSIIMDVHSSHFFRLVHVESLQTGKLPESCNKFLVEQNTPKYFSQCKAGFIK